MATNLAPSKIEGRTSLKRMLGPARWVSLLVLLGVLVMCLTFSWITRDAMVHLPFLKAGKAQADTAATTSTQTTVVDLHPWQIAQALAPLAVSKEEEEFAHEAERLADHDVNQAFAAALRRAGEQRTVPSGEALELTQKVAQLQATLKDDQAQVQSLTQTPGTAQDDLKIAQAQLALDQDELND